MIPPATWFMSLGLTAVLVVQSVSQRVRTTFLWPGVPEGIPVIIECTLEENTMRKFDLNIFINTSTFSHIYLILMQANSAFIG